MKVRKAIIQKDNDQLKQDFIIIQESLKQTLAQKDRKRLVMKQAQSISNSKAHLACLYGISLPSLYYRPVERQPEELRIKRMMDEIHTEHLSWGLIKIWRAVAEFYTDISRHVIEQYMVEMEMKPVCPTSKLYPRSAKHHIYPYCIKKSQLTRPNEAWTTDVTYVLSLHYYKEM